MPSKRNIVRYIFIAFHVLMWIIAVAVPYAQNRNSALLAWHLLIGLALLVYIPAALALAIMDSPSRFTQAGGEVGYLVVQQIMWIQSGSYGAFYGSPSVCAIASSMLNENLETACVGFRIAAACGYLQFFMCIAWMTMVIHEALHSGMPRTEAFNTATHVLLGGTGAGWGGIGSGKRGGKGAKKERGAGAEEAGTGEEKVGLNDYRDAPHGYPHPQHGVPQGQGQGQQYAPAPYGVASTGYGQRDALSTPRMEQGAFDHHHQGQRHNQNRGHPSQYPAYPQTSAYPQPAYEQHSAPRGSRHSSYGSSAPLAPRANAPYEIPPHARAHSFSTSNTSLSSYSPSVPPSHANNGPGARSASPARQVQVQNQAQPPRSAMPQSAHPARTPMATHPVAMLPHETKAAQRYAQRNAGAGTQTQTQTPEAPLTRPEPRWEDAPFRGRSSSESRRSVDLPKIQTGA